MDRMTNKLDKKILYCPRCGKYIIGTVYENILSTEPNYWKCKNNHKIILN